MKKPLSKIANIGVSNLKFLQTTLSGQYKITDRTRQLGISVYVATEIYCISDS